MSSQSVPTVYLHVVDDVINSVRGDFQADNIEETVLNELQTLWELKLMQHGVISASDIPPNLARNVNVGSVQDLNMPYQGTEEFTPTSDMLFSPYGTPTPGPEQTDAARAGDQQNRRRGVDVNVAYQEGQEEDEASAPAGQAPVTKDFFTTSGKRKRDESFYPNNFIPQQDGGADSMNFEIEFSPSTSRIPQRDGPVDGYDDEVEHEDYNEPADEEGQQHQQPATELAQEAQVDADSGGEPPLNELDDDEDDLDGIDQPNDEPSTTHLVLAQFEKVTRSKNKWKCVLKDGIMHLNNRDGLFVKATGEFEF